MAFKGVPETLKDHPGLKNFNPRVRLALSHAVPALRADARDRAGRVQPGSS